MLTKLVFSGFCLIAAHLNSMEAKPDTDDPQELTTLRSQLAAYQKELGEKNDFMERHTLRVTISRLNTQIAALAKTTVDDAATEA